MTAVPARVLVVGLGRIGLPVATSLHNAGFRVVAHDIDPDREDAAVRSGFGWRPDPGVPGEIDAVLTVLPGSPELEHVMLTADGRPGLLQRLGPGTLWIDLTSTAPDVAENLAATAEDRGVDYVDAAVGGGPDAAARRTLTLYVGGTPGGLERARPYLDVIAAGGHIHVMGPPGTGCLTKLLVNVLWFGQVVASTEALLLGRAGGVEPRRLQAVLDAGPAASRFGSDYVPALLRGDYLPAFGIDRVVEELESVRRFAEDRRLPHAVLDVVARTHRAALRRFGPIDGELLAAAHLEADAGRPLSDEVDPRSPSL